jgi:hypothetical protein
MSTRPKEVEMKPTYEEIVKFMKDYVHAYNTYAQNPATVHKMDDYYTPDVLFVPYIATFGGPGNSLNNREDFYRTFIDHPFRYEQFEEADIVVDERRMVATALLGAALFESGTGRVLLRKTYLVRYDLALDENNTLKIKKILFFWEVLPPEFDAEYGIEDLEVLKKGQKGST